MTDGGPVRHLLLLRHAKATTADFGPTAEQTDHARDLAERGRHDASAMGRILRKVGLRPDLVLISSARRTLRTWELLGQFENGPPAVSVSDELYLAEPTTLLSALRRTPDSIVTLMLIGHNPGMHQLALQLCGRNAPLSLQASLGTCTLVHLTHHSDWAELGQVLLASPECLRP